MLLLGEPGFCLSKIDYEVLAFDAL